MEIKFKQSIENIFKNFGKDTDKSFFENAGVMRDGKIYTIKVRSKYSGKGTYIEDVLENERSIPEDFYITEKELPKWEYLKGSKRFEKVSKNGEAFIYSEGSMSFPDSLKKPARTIITSEGGKTPSRFKHVIKTKVGRYRRLTPVELERLSMFPDNHTQTQGCSDTKRAFLIGNALVVGVVERFAKKLGEEHIK